MGAAERAAVKMGAVENDVEERVKLGAAGEGTNEPANKMGATEKDVASRAAGRAAVKSGADRCDAVEMSAVESDAVESDTAV